MALENTTPVPNVCFDVWPHELTATEYQVAMYIVRRTVGFNKSSDFISWDQFLHGIVTSSGKRLDYGCGLTSRSILGKCLQSLIKKGKIQFKVVKRKIYYSPCFGTSVPEVVLKQPTEIESSVPEVVLSSVPEVVLSSVPEVVHTKDSIQKTVNKRKKDANASVSSSSLSTPEKATRTRTRTNKYAYVVPSELVERVANVYSALDQWAQKNISPDYRFTPDSDSDKAICDLLTSSVPPTPSRLEKVCKDMWATDFYKSQIGKVSTICKRYKAMSLSLIALAPNKPAQSNEQPFDYEASQRIMDAAQNTPSAVVPARLRTKKRIEA